MAHLGLFLALSEKEKDALLAPPTDEERVEFMQEIQEKRYDQDSMEFADGLGVEKAWEGLHRAFAGEKDSGNDWWVNTLTDDPLSQAILGHNGVLENEIEAHWLMRLVDPPTVERVAAALTALTEEEYTERYNCYCRGTLRFDDEDYLEYTLGYLDELRKFYNAVAGTGRWVLFSVDW